MGKSSETLNTCDFCGIDDGDLTLVRGLGNIMICELCVEESHLMIQQQNTKKLKNEEYRPKLTPSIIKKHLDKTVVGQERAKRLLSIAVHSHYKRVFTKTKVEIQKSNVLLIGPSGSGKTMLAKQMSKILNLPLVIVDASGLTKAGYIGEDIQGIISKLLMEAKGDIKLAERGIVFVDEFDKLAGVPTDGKRDISGEVQWELLKLIEGDKVFVNPEGSKKNAGSKEVVVDTTNILFIFGGAFSGMASQKAIKSMGISGNIDNPQDYGHVDHYDIIKYGFVPEIVGRIPVIAQLNPLTHSDMKSILCSVKNSILDEYKELLKMDGIEASFDDAFIDQVVSTAMTHPTGARSLRSILENSLEDVLFNAPDMEEKSVSITKDYIKGNSNE